ncbi:hypothetical protein CN97_00735 [Haematobacter massiliensis]|uniref:Tail assembly chaperone n=1 Tax=Haematobacter massiliensis TaxID=195105 RepID=A0A086Y0I6_9RHOB|nr:hypothetical protein [Haematobacter massiliensis]KFI27786.1 hypothetical protein CN97_00735 [Haematobacter massiliensis]OWJ82709.1 hypothetical protein CDV51_17020 [Haematobacter massiliensis]
MDLRGIKRDTSIAQEGQWVKAVPNFEDAEFLVRGWASPKVLAYRSRLERLAPRKDRNADGSIKEAARMRIVAEVLAGVVLLDWRNIGDGGEPLEYSQELAAKIFADPDFVMFTDAVLWASNQVDAQSFMSEQDEGNS